MLILPRMMITVKEALEYKISRSLIPPHTLIMSLSCLLLALSLTTLAGARTSWSQVTNIILAIFSEDVHHFRMLDFPQLKVSQ